MENPYQFPKSRDMYLAKKGYYEVVIPQMNYIYVFIKKYSRISGDLLSFALFFVIFICCDIIHIVLTMKKKQLNIMDSVVVMSIMVKLFLILILMAFLTAGILM